MQDTGHNINRITVKLRIRLKKGIRKFKNVLTVSRQLGINRYNTATIVMDMEDVMLGYDKYSEITSDYDLKETSCVLVVQTEKKLAFVIEVYPINFDLTTINKVQADEYGPYKDTGMVIVTNGIYWKIFKINRGQSIGYLVREFSFLDLNSKDPNDIYKLYRLCREYLRDYGPPVFDDLEAKGESR